MKSRALSAVVVSAAAAFLPACARHGAGYMEQQAARGFQFSGEYLLFSDISNSLSFLVHGDNVYRVAGRLGYETSNNDGSQLYWALQFNPLTPAEVAKCWPKFRDDLQDALSQPDAQEYLSIVNIDWSDPEQLPDGIIIVPYQTAVFSLAKAKELAGVVSVEPNKPNPNL